MKVTLAILAVFLALFLTLAYFHSKAVDRAHLINSANALLVAQEQLRQRETITNASLYTRVYTFTNQVTVGGTEFVCELAADVPGFTNAGSLAATRDGILIWIDSQKGPVIVRGADRRIVIPERFRDY